jgi:hypothetical protein
MPHPPQLPQLDNSNNTWQKVQIMQLFVTQFSSPSHHFILLWSKYSSRQPSVYVLPLLSETMFHTHTEPQGKTVALYILTFTIFWQHIMLTNNALNKSLTDFMKINDFKKYGISMSEWWHAMLTQCSNLVLEKSIFKVCPICKYLNYDSSLQQFQPGYEYIWISRYEFVLNTVHIF